MWISWRGLFLRFEERVPTSQESSPRWGKKKYFSWYLWRKRNYVDLLRHSYVPDGNFFKTYICIVMYNDLEKLNVLIGRYELKIFYFSYFIYTMTILTVRNFNFYQFHYTFQLLWYLSKYTKYLRFFCIFKSWNLFQWFIRFWKWWVFIEV